MPQPQKPELPEWMRNPEPAERTTLGWEMSQAVKRNSRWRKMADAWWRFQERNRITRRYPVTMAILAWVIALVICVSLYILFVVILPGIK